MKSVLAVLACLAAIGVSGSVAADPEPPITEEPAPAPPTDAGPATTATFTLSAEHPIAQGRASLRFYGLRATVTAGSTYRVAAVPETSAAYVEVVPMLDAKSVFVACRVLNEDGHEAMVATPGGDVRVPARTARWVKSAIVLLSHKTTPASARVSIDRCEVTGFGAGTPPPSPQQLPREVVQARHAGARLGRALRAATAAAAPSPLSSGPVTSGITLSAQQPAQAGATLTVTSIASQGDLQLIVAPDENAYFLDARFVEHVIASVIVRVTVPTATNKTHSVVCVVANVGTTPASLSGMTIAPGTSQWLDMKGGGSDFSLENTSFAGSIAIKECRVREQSSAVTPPPRIGGR